MGRRYSISGSDPSIANNTTVMALDSAASVRPLVYDLVVSCRDTPADQASGYQLERFAGGAGTSGSAVTPQALDPSDPASACAAGQATYTAEPTYTANATLLAFNLNQRATFRWVAAPGGELVLPADDDGGLGIVATSPTASFSVDAMIHFEE